jgi:hypothetical protein
MVANPITDDERFERVLRWMRENIDVSSSIYRTTNATLEVDPMVDGAGHPVRTGIEPPEDLANWTMNSGAALICCCYIDALGKVERQLQGEDPKPIAPRFQSFVTAHMSDFVAECAAKGGDYSVATLYKTYRCGFVHEFADAVAIWDRKGRTGDYFFDYYGSPGLNIDRLANGTVEGIQHFRLAFRASARPFADFFKMLEAK